MAKPGRIITFYSYKGGTGRTMAMANIAWILASSGTRVLIIDWDLEAPGLHRYFGPFLDDPSCEQTDGLIDFLLRYIVAAGKPAPSRSSDGNDWYKSYADLTRYAEPILWTFPERGSIDLVTAGRQSDTYPTRVNHFDWKRFYERFGGGEFLDEMSRRLRATYDYVLIDSRTGVSDTSGICTVHLPDALVVLYTLNTQSIEGASGIAADALRQRAAVTTPENMSSETDSSALPFVVFPIATRVELAEKDKLTRQREAARKAFRHFAKGLRQIGLIDSEEDYFGSMEILYDPYYAYEEVLATIFDEPGQSHSVLASLELLTAHLTEGRITQLAPIPESRRAEAQLKYELGDSTRREEGEGRITAPALDVFITSDGERTSQWARRLFDELSPYFSVFEASRSLRAGDEVQTVTKRALDAASSVVAILSAPGVDSDSGRHAIQQALRTGKRLIPVYVDTRARRAWESGFPELERVVAIDATDGDVARGVTRALGHELPRMDEARSELRPMISYLTLRRTIGILGILFPVVLVFGGITLFQTDIQSSISSYYHTGMRNTFVSTIVAIGTLLFLYRGFARTDDIASDLSFVFALGAALFPPTPTDSAPDRAQLIGYVHLASAALFFITQIYFSLFVFTQTDPSGWPTRMKLQRNQVYRACGYLMSLCLALIVIYSLIPEDTGIGRIKPVFWLESLALWAFGVSWFVKGETLWKDYMT